AGDYVGQNHGRIQRIGEAAIEFVEILPDGGGGWVERNRTLALIGSGQ
ncbi:MAG: pilus assembly protein PilP, partial [Gammaproteobacteria bacterium]|nr:pilus assembly protein PilP [Gammaproteobacteria bacterium]